MEDSAYREVQPSDIDPQPKKSQKPRPKKETVGKPKLTKIFETKQKPEPMKQKKRKGRKPKQ